jgi:predicted nucleic acid-binding protein
LEKIEGADVLAGVSGIHLGEAEAILLAQKLGTELIIDEGEASATAQMFEGI